MATGIDAQEVSTDRSRSIGSPTGGRSIRRRDQVGASFARGGERMIKGSIRQAIAGRLRGDRDHRGRLLEPGASTAPHRRAPRHRARRPAPRRLGAPVGRRAKQYTIGYSNGGGVGNGFREEQVCTAKAEAHGVRPGLRAHRDPSQHGCRRPAGRHPRPDREGRQRDRLQPERPDGPQPGTRRGQGGRHQDGLGRRATSPTRTPGTSTTTRSSTRSSAPSGCSISSAARAPSGTRAASPATRPTPTATSGSRTSSRTTRTSRSSRAPTASPPAGIRRRPPS